MASLQLAFDILAKDNASKVFDKVGDSADGTGKKASALTGVGKAVGAALGGVALAGVAGLGAALVNGARDAANMERILAQTGAVIESTGGAAGVTVGSIDAFAGALERSTGVEAEAIVEGQNMLLTFTNIKNGVGEGNQVFDQASTVLADMSVAMGTDMSSSAVLLGKALNDPIAGVGALSKAGVQLTDAQKEQIKGFVESGDAMSAQKIILGELTTQFGGSAEAFGNTLPGQIAKAKNAFGDLFEQIAVNVLPTISEVVVAFTAALPGAIAAVQSGFEAASPYLSAAGTALMTVASAGAAIVSAIPAPVLIGIAAAVGVFGAAMAISAAATAIQTGAMAALNAVLLLNPIGVVVALLVGLVAGLVYAYRESETFRDIVDGAFTKVKEAGQAVADFVTVTIPAAFELVETKVSDAVTAVQTAVSDAWTAVQKKTSDAWTATKTAVSDAVDAVVDFVKALPGRFVDALSSLASDLVGVAVKAWNAWDDAVDSAVAATINFFSGIPGKVVTALATLAAKLFSTATSAWAEFQAAVDGGVGSTLAYVAGIPGRIIGAIGDLSRTLYSAGADLLRGLANGISGAIRGVVDAAVSAANAVVNGVKNALGIRSPSRVFHALGENVSLGFARGIRARQGEVQAAMRELAQIPSEMAANRLAGLRSQQGAAGSPGLTKAIAVATRDTPPPAKTREEYAAQNAAFVAHLEKTVLMNALSRDQRIADALIEQTDILRQMPRTYQLGSRQMTAKGR